LLSMKLSDQAIVKQCLEGDGNAFGLLVAKYQNAVYGLCYHIVGNFADAQDLTQETFVRAYLDLAKIRDLSKFASWLYRVTVNVCKRWLRDRKGANDLPLEAIARQGNELGHDGSPEENAEAEELCLSVREAIASLSERSRLAITLYYIDGLSYEEIGDFLSLSRSAVKSRLHRARKQLKEELISMVEDNFDKHKLPEDFPEKVVQEVVIKSVKMEPEGKAPMVILQNKADEEQVLPIWIGMFEAIAIIQALGEGTKPARPMTHDLMTNILNEFNMKVIRVVVTDLKESTFYARIAIESDGVLKEIDARPSDSMALALRTGVPVFVAKSILSESGIRPTEGPLEPGKLTEVKVDELAGKTFVEVSSLYGIDPKFQSDLDSSSISEELRKELEDKGISLSDNAKVSGGTWQISDEGKRYIVKKERDKLNVYRVAPPKKEEKKEKK
jgi:RNA polymerase sigma factor (sigma-70 family)